MYRPVSKDSAGPSQTPTIIACSVVFTAMSVAAFGLRVYTRFSILQVASYEELLLTVALLLSLAFLVGTIQQVYSGLGNHMWEVSAETLIRFRMQEWYTFAFYRLSLAFTKIAILLLYMRILTRGYVRIASYVVLAAVIISNVWLITSAFIECIPIQAVWDPSVQGWCLSLDLVGMLNSVLHVITDFAIFALPIPAIWSLRMPRNQKISLITLFGLGFFVCIVSIIRIIYLRYIVNFFDETYGMSGIAIWGSVEMNLAIICACAATLKPLVNKWFPHRLGSNTTATQPAQHTIRMSTARQTMRTEMDLTGGGPFIRLDELEHANDHSDPSIDDDLEHGLGARGLPRAAPSSTSHLVGR